MLDIVLITVGKIKEPYYRDAIEEYLKRLKPYAKVSVEEIPETSFIDSHDADRIKKQEGERIISALKKHRDPYIFLLEEHGKRFTSTEFAKQLEQIRGTIVFVIGGTLGLSEDIQVRYPQHLSLSSMTFTHGMARVFLLEQMYRAVTIITGKNYHY